MKLIFRNISLALIGLISLVACNDDDQLSQIGEQVQPAKDIVSGEHTSIKFTAATVATNEVFTTGQSSLLGEIADPAFGGFRAQFISEVRTAPNFQFSADPEGGQIDSIRLLIKFVDIVGNSNARQKINVYEVERGFQGERLSVTDLNSYTHEDRLVGSAVIAPNTDAFYSRITANDSIPVVRVLLNKELGQRLYDATKAHPEYYLTQSAFSQNLLGGLLVTTTTGSGYVLQTSGIALEVFYHTTDQAKVARKETFINTKFTPGLSAFSNTNIEGLVGQRSDYSYIKSPAGVHTELTLSTEELSKLLRGKSADIFRSGAWRLSDIQLTLPVETIEGSLLNPPSYTLLIPRESVQNFFNKGYTELSTPNTAILSSVYSITSRQYSFSNIASIIYEHLRLEENRHYDTAQKQWVIDKPLHLAVIPVHRRTGRTSGGELVTSELTANLVPNLVRLQTNETTLTTKAISTEFKL